MTTRRNFIAGLLATAAAPVLPATRIAPPIGGMIATQSVVFVPGRIWALTETGMFCWSGQCDPNDWSAVTP